MQFKHRLLALGVVIIFVAAAANRIDAAYAHGCPAQLSGSYSCNISPTGILSSYSEIISIVSIVVMALIVAMLIFKFDYLQRRDFYAVKYSPTTSRINRLLFEGRDKRKIIVAMPFLVFGCYIIAEGLYSMFTYGNLRSVDYAIMIVLFSLPFFAIGAFLIAFGLKAISFVTLKKEPLSA